MSAYDQVEPDQQFEVLRAEALLHGQPQLTVDPLTPLGQQHEDVVTQQVALAEADTGVVDRLEDAVHVVARFGGDLHDRQQPFEDVFHGLQPVLRIRGFLPLGERSEEEPVGESDVAAATCLRGRADARGERLTVGLGGQQPIVVERFLVLVHEDLTVYSLGAPGVARFLELVAQCGERQHQRGETLLTVHDQPFLYSTGLDLAWSENDGAEEVWRRALTCPVLLDKLADVFPQPFQLLLAPAVRPLVERNLELLLPLDEIEKGDFLGAHVIPSLPRPTIVRSASRRRVVLRQVRELASPQLGVVTGT